jgi:hypothetical protein
VPPSYGRGVARPAPSSEGSSRTIRNPLNGDKRMPDGSRRKRRQGHTPRARYYSLYRSIRFARRFGGVEVNLLYVLKRRGVNIPQKEAH